MNLSLNERRRRLRDLAQTHAGLVLASALIKGNDARGTPAERPPAAPAVNHNRIGGVDAEKAKPCDPARAVRRGTPASGKRAGYNRAVQLNLSTTAR